MVLAFGLSLIMTLPSIRHADSASPSTDVLTEKPILRTDSRGAPRVVMESSGQTAVGYATTPSSAR